MQDSDAKQKSYAIAEAALDLMRQHGVDPTPQNFATWHAYSAGEHNEIIRTIDVIVQNNRPFTPKLCAELHEQFFQDSEPAQRIASTSEQIEDSIAHVLASLEQAGQDAEAYEKSLQSFSGELKQDQSTDLAEVVGQVLGETRKMEAQNHSLRDQLATSSGEIAQLREDLEAVRREAMTDSLTGIGNRKLFDTMLQEVTRQARKTRSTASLILLDIDHFKRFNDNFGHQLGDQVLRLVGRTLTECVKGRDVVARYGGEEFAIVLPETPLANAAAVADHIRRTVANKKVVRKTTGEELTQITISLGVAEYFPGEDLVTLIERSDTALYAAKHAGRNKVCVQERKNLTLAASA